MLYYRILIHRPLAMPLCQFFVDMLTVFVAFPSIHLVHTLPQHLLTPRGGCGILPPRRIFFSKRAIPRRFTGSSFKMMEPWLLVGQ
jgi:hypothetical protein